MNIQKVCIIGAGNVGISLAVDISASSVKDIVLLTTKNELSSKEFTKIDSDSGKIFKTSRINVTTDYGKGIEGSDIVFITLPSFMIESCVKEVSKYSPKIIIFVPGYGGKEFFCEKLIEQGCLVAGFDRSPYVARLSGSYEVVASTKKSVRLGCISREKTEYVCELLLSFLSFECRPVDNYLTVTLTPSNPILHTARLYTIFKDAKAESIFPSMIKFYGDWNDLSSNILLDMDSELQSICNSFSDIDLSGVIPLSIHYESDTVESLTNKIKSIKSWHNLDSPMKKIGDHYLIDLESRYFQEDFPFGLCVLKAFAQIVDVETPVMDEVLCWYQKLSGLQFSDFGGKLDIKAIPFGSVPQRFGILNPSDVEKFYFGR